MKRFVFWQILIAALLMAPDSQAQSLKDLLNKENRVSGFPRLASFLLSV